MSSHEYIAQIKAEEAEERMAHIVADAAAALDVALAAHWECVKASSAAHAAYRKAVSAQRRNRTAATVAAVKAADTEIIRARLAEDAAFVAVRRVPHYGDRQLRLICPSI